MELIYFSHKHNYIQREKSFKLKDHLITSFQTWIYGGKYTSSSI